METPGQDERAKVCNYNSLKDDKAEKCEKQGPKVEHMLSLHQGSVGLLQNVPFKFRDGERFKRKNQQIQQLLSTLQRHFGEQRGGHGVPSAGKRATTFW
jgi:hypothetical protein